MSALSSALLSFGAIGLPFGAVFTYYYNRIQANNKEDEIMLALYHTAVSIAIALGFIMVIYQGYLALNGMLFRGM